MTLPINPRFNPKALASRKALFSNLTEQDKISIGLSNAGQRLFLATLDEVVRKAEMRMV